MTTVPKSNQIIVETEAKLTLPNNRSDDGLQPGDAIFYMHELHWKLCIHFFLNCAK